ncbi:methyltransferase domain-containing protein [Pseudonocardia phyllosphaerae]|uniref:methyltransferase domain-containing protein n=1 Tax=Pseudonocardia phyllosphaerae TaxID=3390502 RepID=UPI00397ACB4D
MPSAENARARLVADLERDGRVRSPRIRDALEAVPRHLFLPGIDLADAYLDGAVTIKQDDDGAAVSSVSQPSMVAIMLEQLDARPGDRVLEIGAGGGWNAGLLAHLVGSGGAVTSVDIDDDLVAGARANLAAAGLERVETVTGDGALGYPPSAPYDRIELTVGTSGVRREWVEQLAPDGRLVLPLTVRGSQLSVAFTRTGPGRLESTSVRSCAFIRLRGEGADPDGSNGCRAGSWTVFPVDPGSAGPGATADGPPRGSGGAADTVTGWLGEPAGDRPAPIGGSPADLWDGLGLWCAVADPAVFRLVGPSSGGLADTLFPLPGSRGTLGVASPDGCALLLAEPSATVRGFGPGGAVAAARLIALLEGWVGAGCPHASDLRVEAVVPGLEPSAEPDPTEIVDGAGTVLRPSWGGGPKAERLSS